MIARAGPRKTTLCYIEVFAMIGIVGSGKSTSCCILR